MHYRRNRESAESKHWSRSLSRSCVQTIISMGTRGKPEGSVHRDDNSFRWDKEERVRCR